MSRGKEETFYPSDVLAAIQYAKTLDANDKFGDKAFSVDVKGLRDGNNGTRWMTLSCLKKDNAGKWRYLPLKLRNKNLRTTARILTEDEKKSKGKDRTFPGISLTFKGTSEFTLKTKDPKTGKMRESVEKYGEVKILIAKAFNRIMKQILDSNTIYMDNKKINLNVQLFRWIDKNAGKKEKLEDPPIRVTLPFDKEGQSIAKFAIPTIDIYDADKPIHAKDGKGLVAGCVPFHQAVDDEGKPYNYTTIRGFIRCGSNTTFVEDLSGVCISAQGASNPSKIDNFLIIKKGSGNRMTANEAFDTNDFDDIAGAETGAADADEASEEVEKPTTKVVDDDDLEASDEAPAVTASKPVDDLDDDDF